MSFPTISRRTTTAACAGIGAAALLAVAAPAQAATEVEWPEEFTSAFHAVAVPENVVDADGEPAPGEEGATGDFMLWANADMNVICYEITLEGVTGEYESPAVTATHIHDADAGEGGPPVVAFADPEPEGETTRMSSGCLQGPFETGVEDDDGNDAGMSFTVEDLEADPAGFSVDTHTADFVPGAVRAQLAQVPLDGMETGGGGTAVAAGPEAMASTGSGSSVAAPAAGAGALALLGAGALLYFRRARGAKA